LFTDAAISASAEASALIVNSSQPAIQNTVLANTLPLLAA
jgi:hypothetical protein